VLGPHEAWSLFSVGTLALAIAAIAIAWPRVVAYPVAAVALIAVVTMFARAWKAR
jgi:hypothetical protein